MPGRFFDTSVLLSIASGDPVKVDRAEAIIGGAVGVQVMNELTNVARREMRLSWRETRSFLSTARGMLAVHPVTIEMHETGPALAERCNPSIFDAMNAASALHADCDMLWSEDMRHGIELDGRLRVVNPFRAPG